MYIAHEKQTKLQEFDWTLIQLIHEIRIVVSFYKLI